MENLSLIEFKRVLDEKQFNEPFTTNLISTMSFITTTSRNQYSDYKDETNDVTSLFYQGKYEFKTDYSIIYLYDYMNDNESKDFIEMYGGQLHNKTSSNITILTYFSTYTASKWVNVHNRNKIGYGEDNNASQVMETMNYLKKAYHVEKLPAMIIMKIDKDKKEESFCISLDDCNKNTIRQAFLNVIKKIDDHCEEDFEVVRDSISGRNKAILKSKTMQELQMSEFISKMIKDEKESRYSLSLDMGISERTLYNKIYKQENGLFTRDECFFLAIRFGLSVPKLNKLLRDNDHVDLAMEGRDGYIFKTLVNNEKGRDKVREIHYLLISKGEKGLLNSKSELL